MIPTRIYLENFMGHKLTDIDCTVFSSALIVGESKNNSRESNGVGKTTIYHAVDYALFGSVPSDTIDEIIRDGENECKVIFEFEFEGDSKRYRIQRIRRKRSKKSYVELYQLTGDKWENISQKTATETNAEITNIIGINYSAFHNSILFSQSDLSGLASDGPDKKKSTLKDALGLLIYKKFEALGVKEVKKLEPKIDGKKAIVANLGSPADDIAGFEKELEAVNKSINGTKKELSDAEITLKERRAELSDLNRLVSSDAAVVHDKLADIKKSKQQANSTILSKTNLLDSKEKELAAKTLASQKLDDELDALQKKYDELCDKEISSPEAEEKKSD